MKRDWNVIRELLEEIQVGDTKDLYGSLSKPLKELTEHERMRRQHFLLVSEDGPGRCLSRGGELTMLGHDVLEALQDKTVQKAIDMGLPITLEGLIMLAREISC